MALLQKCMKVSFLSNKKHKTGEVINLMQVDTSRLQWVGYYLAVVMFMPIQIVVALYLMFDFIGISFLAGLGVIFLTSIFNFLIGKQTWVLQKALMKAKDDRTKQANELYSSIKFVKVNAFEDYFIGKLLNFREKEMTVLKSRFLIGCFNVLLLWLSPMLIINATFAMYVLLGNQLTAANTFTLISLFQILQEPLRSLP
jgi:ABC-type multidrug transport system fused ATPase/permease subunit